MTSAPARRAFLKGNFQPKAVVRPLGAATDMSFFDACTQCGDCARACPEQIIQRDSDGFPAVEFAAGACTFCNACTEACPTEALSPATGWNWRATADQTCLSKNAITCRSCEDHCDSQAIRFRLMTGGRSEPVFDTDACTGCGACAPVCPAQAITFHHIQQPDGGLQC
ncbi:MAG: ferredoxin-type protein NapF [Thalassovita sp.]